ncbi:MAG TPA: Error-prone repair protein ImuA [Ferruginibacter sp.]|nr:Error-prone repair protein ImuA [Ferruginibacter sp.]
MAASKSDIIAQLQKDILPLQGVRNVLRNTRLDAGLGPINNAFPGNSFPLGAIHEFISLNAEAATASCGFIAGIISSLMRNRGALLWISTSRNIFPPALQSFGIAPDKIIFIDLKKDKEVLWAMEEALKCKGLAAVVGEIKELDFTASRRLQLAVETSKSTGFILRKNPTHILTTACVTRWQISSIKSELETGMPGVGFPRWNVELLKVRNGKPGTWQVEFSAGRFRHLSTAIAVPLIQKKKTG